MLTLLIILLCIMFADEIFALGALLMLVGVPVGILGLFVFLVFSIK